MSNPRKLAAALAVVTLMGAACGRLYQDEDGPGSGDGSISHPTGADELVLRIDVGGGFVPVEYNLAAIPGVSIFGDGRMILTGPVIEIYPGPALPNLQVTQLTEDALQAILRAAEDAGLMAGDANYDYPCVTDVPATTFTVVADGTTNVVSAYALGFDESAGSCEGVNEEARAALVEFQSALGDLESLVPEGSIGETTPYLPTEMRVFVQPYRGEPELSQESVRWPVSEPLATFGEPVEVVEGMRCGAVSGEDLDALLEAALTANQLTPWVDDEGTERSAIFRPLLPDERGC